MKLAAIALAAVAVANAGCERRFPSVIQRSERVHLESLVKIPADIYRRDVPSVAQYKRYYTVTFIKGRRMIWGYFVRSDKPGIYHVASRYDFPSIDDGGCGVVQVLYDVEAKRIDVLVCNGVA